MTAAALQQRLLPQRMLIRDCVNYDGLDAHYFRVAVRSEAKNARLLAALGDCLGTRILRSSGSTPALILQGPQYRQIV